MPLYRKKPTIIEARLFDPGVDYDHALDVCSWAGGSPDTEGCIISTLEGDMLAVPGDFIIKGVQGEFYPCKPDIFDATYEYVSPAPPLDGTDD